MKFGFRKPSLTKRIAARTSLKRYARHSLGLKAPRGWGFITDPKRAVYNKIYNRTSFGCLIIVFAVCSPAIGAIAGLLFKQMHSL